MLLDDEALFDAQVAGPLLIVRLSLHEHDVRGACAVPTVEIKEFRVAL